MKKDVVKTTNAVTKKSTTSTTTKGKKTIDPKNRPALPAKGAAKKAAADTKKPVAKKDAKAESMNPPVPAFSDADKQHYGELVTMLKESWTTAQRATMATAFILHEIYNTGLYRVDGYKNIYQFGAEMFGQSKSTVNRLINIVERFGERIECGRPIHEIDAKYSGYSQSQLEAMLGHTDDELKDIKPEMSVREIKAALKKTDSKEEAAPNTEESASGGSGDGEETPVTQEHALLIWQFDKAAEFDNLLAHENDLEYAKFLNIIRDCLKKGHKVRVLDVYETK